MAALSFSGFDMQASGESGTASRQIHWSGTDSQPSSERAPLLPATRLTIYRSHLLYQPLPLGFAYGLSLPVLDDFLAAGSAGAVAFSWTNDPDAAGYQIQLFSGGVWSDYGAALPSGSTSSAAAPAAGTYLFRLQVETPAVTYSNTSQAVVS